MRYRFPACVGTAVSCLLLGLSASLARAQGATGVALSKWLLLGPIPARIAAFAPENDSTLLASTHLSVDHLWPSVNRRMAWLGRDSATWTSAGSADALRLDAPAVRSVLYAVTYVDADRFARGTLVIDGVAAARRRVSLDGVPVGADSVTLARGKHMLLVQILQAAGTPITLTVRFQSSTPDVRISSTTDPRHPARLDELMSTTRIRDIAVDPTGKRAAWITRRGDGGTDRFINAVEVHDLSTGQLVAQLGAPDAAAPRWSRDGSKLAFQTATDRPDAVGRDLWIWDVRDGSSTRVLRGERGLSGAEWGAGSDWLYVTSSTRRGAPDGFKPGDAQRLTDVWDRWSFWPDKARLSGVNIATGTRLDLVDDSLYSVEGARLSPDGRHVVFARSVRTTDARPWLRAELWLLDLNDLGSRKLLDLPREAFGAPTMFAWSPDGNAVAFCASAAELLTHPDSTFSVYESELYGVNLAHPSLVRLSANFAPAVVCSQDIAWNARDSRIYVTADAGARTIPARTSGPVASALVRPPGLEAMPIPGEAITAYGIGTTEIVAAIETPTTAAVVYRIPLAGGPAGVIDRPSIKALSDAVEMPAWRPWEFVNKAGTKIEAWYWTPPDFDSTKTYPMIVHYYGGTLPMKKSFDERLVWFAANGYVVLMLNPAGAPGYGQAFANLHINDWGFPAGSDIIEGVQQFERTHAFVDARRVGNFGHSYGGFMTMHLATRTNIFSTSISIAGISNIAEYWGGGWTGYSYTEGTCPGCYPWNRRDVFVERSPLFQADRIHTPMLLIHGTSDTNVPTSESEQMFTALRMLGRDVEYVRIYGENHGIDSRPSVTRTLYGTMLDWYDKRLRSEPAAWSARWQPTSTSSRASDGARPPEH